MAKDQSWIADLLTGNGGGGSTTLANSFVQPPHGSTVVIAVADSTSASAGNTATVNGTQKYTVTNVSGDNVTLLNDTLTNSASGTIASGSVVVFGGPAVPNLVAPRFFADLATTTPTATRAIVTTDGYAAVGDGGHGTWAWTLGTFANDGGTIVVPTGQSGIGAWVRQRGADNILRASFFGAFPGGSPSADVGINAALQVAKNDPSNPRVWLDGTSVNDEYFINEPIFVPTAVHFSAQDTNTHFGTNALSCLRPLFCGPAVVARSDSPVAPITQDGASGFYGVKLGPAGGGIYTVLSMTSCGTLTFPAYTIEFWVKATIGASGVIFQSSGHRRWWEISQVSLNVVLNADNTLTSHITTTGNSVHLNNNYGALVNSSAVPSATRTKVAFSYDGSFLRCYVGGTYISKVACTGNIAQSVWESAVLGGGIDQYPASRFTTGADCEIYNLRLSKAARYTSEAGGVVYPPESAPFANTDSDTLLILAFNPGENLTPTGVQKGLTQYGSTYGGLGANTPVWLIWQNLATAQTTGATISNIGVITPNNPGVMGFYCELMPQVKILHCSSNAQIGLWLNNNCYLGTVEGCTLGGGGSEGIQAPLVMTGANGLMTVRDCKLSAGASQYAMALLDSGGLFERIYPTPSGGSGNFFMASVGGGSAGSTFIECYPGDESGSITEHCMLFSGGPFDITYIGGTIQVTSANVPMVDIDVDPESDSVHGGNFDFDTVFFNGNALQPCISFRHPTNTPVRIRKGSGVNTELSGGVMPAFVDPAHPGYVLVEDQEYMSNDLTFTSDADMVLSFNDYLWGTLDVHDPAGNLTTARNLVFPINDEGRIRTVYNRTAKTLTIKGASGVGSTLAAGFVGEFQCKRGVWQLIGTAIAITAFDPSALPGCGLWLKADAGVTQTGTVSAWTDQSGNGNNAAQATGGLQPAYSATSTNLNGKPTIIHDGTTWMSVANAASLHATGDFTMATVVWITTNGNNLLLSKGNAGEWDLNELGGIGMTVSRNGVFADFAQEGGFVNGHAYVVVQVMRNKEWNVWVNGVFHPSSTFPYSGTPTTTTDPVRFGLRDDNITRLIGEQPEILFYNQAQSISDVHALTAYLANKYNVPVANY